MFSIGTEADLSERPGELSAVLTELHTELERVGAALPVGVALRPIFAAEALAGLVLELTSDGASSLFVCTAQRGRGAGDFVVEWLVTQDRALLLPAASSAAGYFEERGYTVASSASPHLRLEPPTRAAGLRAAGSVCLYCAPAREVLIGRRLSPPWPGYWAFPGGKLEPGEDALSGALRELREETGIALEPAAAPALETRVYAGGFGRVYAIDNFCIVTQARPVPIASPELEARWVPLDAALTLRPMAAGTRRVVRRVLARLLGAAGDYERR